MPYRITAENVKDVFTYVQPATEDVAAAHLHVQAAATQCAKEFFTACPESHELTLAIRCLQEAKMWANAAIAHDGRF